MAKKTDPEDRPFATLFEVTVTLRRGPPLRVGCTYPMFERLVHAVQTGPEYLWLQSHLSELDVLLRRSSIISVFCGGQTPDCKTPIPCLTTLNQSTWTDYEDGGSELERHGVRC